MTDGRSFEVLAPAKINLTLHVTGQRDDGYHLLDSLVVFADVGDVLRLTPGEVLSLAVTGPFSAGVPTDQKNLVWRAAELAGWRGHIELEKNLPHGGGIGGGSSDAGALLRAARYDDDASSLGADVPVCRFGQAARMSGMGQKIEPILHGAHFFAVLVNPGCHVPTPQVFQQLAQKNNAAMEPLPPGDAGSSDWITWLARQRNDLETPAQHVAPVIEEAIHALHQTDALLLARMSGSGSTCFGLYPTLDTARTMAQALKSDHPNWWCVATVLS